VQRAERRADGIDRKLEIFLNDGRVSRPHARLFRQKGRFHVEDSGSKNGLRLNGTVARCEELADGDLLEIGHSFFVYRERDDAAKESVRETGEPARRLHGISSFLPELSRDLLTLAKVAASNISVVLLGETGTGKEVIARALHEASERNGPFVAVNCGGIPRELLEAEFFGVRKGAYTGATEARLGHVRSAEGGTLFLDEIAELPATAQVALLRVLQTHEVTPVGEAKPVAVDFRVVAATNRDLLGEVRAGRFRDDLFARLGGLAVTVPPLRRRREDLGILIPALLARHGADKDLRIEVDAARALLLYDWPLNVREVEKALETALALAKDTIELSGLPATVTSPKADAAPDLEDDDAIRQRLQTLLAEHEGNISAVARAMGRHRVQIRRWIRRFGLSSSAT
jgi:DNA-binding NtrC family response regulator